MNVFFRGTVVIAIIFLVGTASVGQDPVTATITLDPDASDNISIDKESIPVSPGQPIVWLIVNQYATPRPVMLDDFKKGRKGASECVDETTPENPMRGSDLNTNVPAKSGDTPGYGAIAATVYSGAADCYKYTIKSGSEEKDPELDIET